MTGLELRQLRGCGQVWHISMPRACGGIYIDRGGIVLAASIELAEFLGWHIERVGAAVTRGRGLLVLAWLA